MSTLAYKSNIEKVRVTLWKTSIEFNDGFKDQSELPTFEQAIEWLDEARDNHIKSLTEEQ